MQSEIATCLKIYAIASFELSLASTHLI